MKDWARLGAVTDGVCDEKIDDKLVLQIGIPDGC